MAAHTCRDCVGLLVDFLEGALPAETTAALHEHFEACPPCMDFLDQYRAASSLSRRALDQEMPDEVASKLEAFLKHSCS